MSDTIDTMIDRTIGGISLTVRTVADYDPDLSWIGRYVDYAKRDRKVPIYSRETSGILMPSSDQLWRDERGRIVREPAEYGIGREYRFVELTDAADSLRSALMDARRLEAYGSQHWMMIGIIARVHVNGRLIGDASLWGIESDSDASYIRSVALEMARDAISVTREWFAQLSAESRQAAAS